MKKNLTNILLVVILLVGAAILLYPTFSDYWNSFHQSQAIASYSDSVANLNEAEYERIWQEAVDYNAEMSGKSIPYTLSEAEWADYESQLNFSGNGIMGYIDIPKINVSLPIYHGTSESVLQIATGHIESSSLPVGGPSTHCIISGHRGLPSAKLFTDLDQMAEGDLFQLKILNEVMTYEVDQIRIVLPSELDTLGIIQGQDHCTLVTCTPYGINSHRLLVRGKRVANPETESNARVTSDAIRIDPLLVAPAAAAPILVAMAVWLIINPGGKKKKKGKERAQKPKKEKKTHKDENFT